MNRPSIGALFQRTFFWLQALACLTQGAEHSADVLVYGATPAGVCAAVGAAREGVSVLLVEPSPHVGGVNTGGLSFSDSNQMWRVALRGLFEEFHQRIESDYNARGVKLPYSVAEKDQKVWTYEPHVAARVTDALLKEAGVRVLTGQVLSRTEKDGARVKSIATAKGDAFTAKTFVDATYEGDLMAAAGVSWVIGREGRKEFGESLAGKQYPKAPMPISGLDPQGKLLPLITTKDAGPDEDGDRNVMVYSFRLCVTVKPENRVPFPEPAKYDPARFEAVRRYFAVEKKPVLLWDLYPLPGEKADANNGIGKQFSMGIIGGGNAWCESDTAGRAKIWEEHKQYTLELYRFLTTDPAVPQNLRDQLSKYGLCKDEFAATDHWSPQLYVREGRRMRGAHVMTQADILETNIKPDSIAVASFPIDSHDCQRVARGDSEVINEGTIFPFRLNKAQRAGPAYQVPYRAITPKAGECTNVLVPVALSATHVAYSSIRVEPAWMTIGHSAGIAAALAARGGTEVQRLDYAKLRERLLAQKQALELPSPPAVEPRNARAAVEQAHAEMWRRFVDRHNVLLDFTELDGSVVIPTPEECRLGKPNALGWWSPIENGPMFNGLYMDAAVNRWRLTKADADAAKVRRLAEGLMFLASLSEVKGFVARGAAADGKAHYPMGSDDQTLPWFLGLWRYLESGLATPEERARIIAELTETAEAIVALDWQMPAEPPFGVRGGFRSFLFYSAPRLLFVAKLMHQVTGDAKWDARYRAALDERGGPQSASRRELCERGLVFEHAGRQAWTASCPVAALRGLWEMETDDPLRAAYARGLAASVPVAAEFLQLADKFDVADRSSFDGDWRKMNAHWKPQATEQEAVALAQAQLKDFGRTRSPRRGKETAFVRDPAFAAWIITLCPDRALVEPHRAAIERVLTHYRYEQLHYSQFFPVESAWYRLQFK